MINLNIKKESGRSMIEMLGVLAIIGVLSVGGIAGYSKAMMKYKINKAIEQITLIAGNVRTFFGSQRNYEGLDTSEDTGRAIVKKAKLVPDEMVEGEYIKNVFGEAINLYKREKSTIGDSQAFAIHYDLGYNEETCIELLSQDWTMLSSNVIIEYQFGPDFYLLPPLDIDKAVLLCSKMKEFDGYYGLHLNIDINPSSDYWKQLLSDCKLPDGC